MSQSDYNLQQNFEQNLQYDVQDEKQIVKSSIYPITGQSQRNSHNQKQSLRKPPLNNNLNKSSIKQKQQLNNKLQQSIKLKSKSFNRKQSNTQQQNESIIKIYRQLQYPNQIRKIFRKFLYFTNQNNNNKNDQKVYKLITTQLKDKCEIQIKRLNLIKQQNKQVQRFMINQDIEQTDNQLSIVALRQNIKLLIQLKVQNQKIKSINITSQQRMNQQIMSNNNINKITARQYQNLLLEIQKNDQAIKKFVNSNLKLANPNDLNIIQCKKFFRKQLNNINKSSDKIILSKKILIQIIIYLCRLIQGQILSFQDVYTSNQVITYTQQVQDQNGKIIYNNKNTKVKQTKVKHLDQSFSDRDDHLSDRSGSNMFSNTWNGLSSQDLGLKVNQLSQICQQIPQLQTFTRNLKFSKITLQNRQSFFKIVQVIIALHRKVGYLSRNKPTLLRQMEDIEFQLGSISSSVRQFVYSLQSQLPNFAKINFNKDDQQNSKHQMTELLCQLRKDLRKLAQIIEAQDKFQNQMYDKIALIKTIIEAFWLSINEEGDQTWQQFFKKVSSQGLDQQQNHILHQLNECLIIFDNQLKNVQKNQSSLETQRKLQNEVHTLLQDYQRIKAQNLQLKKDLNDVIQQRDQMQLDIEQRNQMIINLTNVKVSLQKRQRVLKDQLLNAQQDCRSFQQIINQLQMQLERLSHQNQNHHKELIYDHQDQVKQLIDKISQLQNTKMDLLNKYQQQCLKSIQTLHGSNNTNLQLQSLKQLFQKKTKQFQDISKRQKHSINNLQKQILQLKNEKKLLENQLQLSQKNKKRLMQKLDDISNKSSQNIKDIHGKFQDQLGNLRDNNFILQKQLQKTKRNINLLTDQLQNLKTQLQSSLKLSNQYRIKLSNSANLQKEYDILNKEYQHLYKTLQKSEISNETHKNKINEFLNKLDQLNDQLITYKDNLRKQQKKAIQLQQKVKQLQKNNQLLDNQNKSLNKNNKTKQKKIMQLQQQLQSMQLSLKSRQKNSSSLLTRTQQKHKQLIQQQQNQITKLIEKIKQLQKQKQKSDKEIIQLSRDIKQNQATYQIKYDQWIRGKKQNQKRIGQFNDRIKQLQESLNRTNIINKELKDNIKTINQDKQEKELELVSINQEIKDLKLQILALEKSQAKYKAIEQRLLNQNNSINDQLTKLRKKLNQKQKQLKQLIYDFEQKQKNFTNQTRLRQNKRFKQQMKQRTNQLIQTKQKQIHILRQQIITEKNTIMQQNQQLHQQNKNLQQQIQKLRKLNELLQKNVNKMQKYSVQNYNQLENKIKQLIKQGEQNKIKYQTNIFDSTKQLQFLKKKNNDLILKLQQKTRLISQQDNKIFQHQLSMNNIQKQNKQYKLKIQSLNSQIQLINTSIQKLKYNKIKSLQNQIDDLNNLIYQSKKRQDLAKHNLNDLEIEIERLKKEYNKKIQTLKQEKVELQQYYKGLYEKQESQHVIEIQNLQRKIKKQSENQFSQLLIKQKENFHIFSIEKMQQLVQIKKKYQKIIKDQKYQKQNIQDQYNNLLKKFNNLMKSYQILVNKDNQNLNNTITQEQLNKLKSQNDFLKRQSLRQSQQIQRLQKQSVQQKQQNSNLITKQIQLEHNISLLNAKNNQLNLNLQTTMKSLINYSQLQKYNIQLQREIQKYKNKSLIQQVKINDLKNYINQLEIKIQDIDNKTSSYRNKQFQFISANNELKQKNKLLIIQLNQLKDKINGLQQDLINKDQKIKQKELLIFNLEQEIIAKTKNIQDKQRQLRQIQNNFNVFKFNMQKQSQNWNDNQRYYKQQIDKLIHKIQQLQIELQNYKLSINQSSKIATDLNQLSRNYHILNDQFNHTQNQLNFSNERFKRLKQQNNNLINQRDQILNVKSSLQIQLEKFKYQNNQLKSQLNAINNDLKRTKQENCRLIKEIQFLEKGSLKSNQLENQIKKFKDFYQKQRNKLLNDHQHQKSNIIQEFEHRLNELNTKCKKFEDKNQQLNNLLGKYNKDQEQLNKYADKLRQQNMQLSDHCKKYEQKIFILQRQKQNIHGNLGNMNQQYQIRFTQLNQQKNLLLNDKQRLNNQIIKLKAQIEQLMRKNYQIQNDKGQNQSKSKLQINDLQNKLKRMQQTLNQFQLNKSRQFNQFQQFKNNLIGQNQHFKKIISQLQQQINHLNLILRQQSNDFNNQIHNIEKDNNLAIENYKRKINELQNNNSNLLNELTSKQIQSIQQQNAQMVRLRNQSAIKGQQIIRLNQIISEKQINYFNQNIKYNDQRNLLIRDIQSYKNQIKLLQKQNNNLHQQEKSLKFNQNKLINQNNLLKSDLNRFSSENQRLKIQSNNLFIEIKKLTQEINKIKFQFNRLKIENQRILKDISNKQITIAHYAAQIQRLTGQLNSRSYLSTNIKNDLEKSQIQIKNLKKSYSNLQQQNQQLKNKLNQNQKFILEMQKQIKQGKLVFQSAGKQLRQLKIQKQNILRGNHQLRGAYDNIHKQNKQKQIIIMNLSTQITQLQQENLLNRSRNTTPINLVTKSYIYQGGKITAQQFHKLHQQYLRVLKELQLKDNLIEKLKTQINEYKKQITILKEQIQLMSEGKTINLRGYTRVTNPNDMTLNPRGIIYTQYDVKQMKAKIQLLEKSVSRYQNRENQLLNQIQKYKFREKQYQDQIKSLQQQQNSKNAKSNVIIKSKQDQAKNMTKITSFNNQSRNTIQNGRSTYKLQGRIQQVQKTINLNHTHKNSSFMRIQGNQLSQMIQRISYSNHIMSKKIDELLNNSIKITFSQTFQKTITSTQFNLPISIINEIRQTAHQNKALVQTLKTLKQNREDIDLLLTEYIDPELVTEFVYRILTYFSQVQNGSQYAISIRQQLQRIRKQNVGGFYFTVLEEYTKYILQNNSIEIYKEQLRQKARDLQQLKLKLDSLFDKNFSQNSRLLNKSSSKSSLMSRSRGKYETSKQQNSYADIGRSRTKKSVKQQNDGLLLNPTLITMNHQKINSISNMLQDSRASSILSYTPYSLQTTNFVSNTINNNPVIQNSSKGSQFRPPVVFLNQNSSTANFFNLGHDNNSLNTSENNLGVKFITVSGNQTTTKVVTNNTTTLNQNSSLSNFNNTVNFNQNGNGKNVIYHHRTINIGENNKN